MKHIKKIGLIIGIRYSADWSLRRPAKEEESLPPMKGFGTQSLRSNNHPSGIPSRNRSNTTRGCTAISCL